MSKSWRYLVAVILTLLGDVPALVARAADVPKYDHIFLIVMENHGYSQILDNPAAPNLNSLAASYGLATQYFSIPGSSAPNYVSMLGGNYFGIQDDSPYYLHTIDSPSLMQQLDSAGLAWKAYYQNMPYPGYRETCYPARCNGIPDFSPLYASKHNGAIYFKATQKNTADRLRMVPIDELAADLQQNPPTFAYVLPDQCHNMHGAPPWCGDSGNPGDANDVQLVSRGDAYVGALVAQITTAPFWSRGVNAIVLTFDGGNGNAGCCDAVPGSGRVFAIVVTSKGPRGLRDSTPYNHYSMLQTVQRAFRLGCLEFTCDTANVVPMAPLFAVVP